MGRSLCSRLTKREGAFCLVFSVASLIFEVVLVAQEPPAQDVNLRARLSVSGPG